MYSSLQWKKIGGFVLQSSCDWRHKWSTFRLLWLTSSGPGPKPLDGRISLFTLWEQGYDIFVLRFQPKTSSCQLPYQRPSSSADCARELFKGLNESDSHLDCTWKKIFGWGLQIFCEWRLKWSSFWAILAHVAWPWAQPLGHSVSLRFSLETRLESESFELLIHFLAFLVQKLWSKINKLINYLIH